MYTVCSNWCSCFIFSGKGPRKNADKLQISMPNSQVVLATSATTLSHVQVHAHTHTHTLITTSIPSSWWRHIHNIHSPHSPKELWSDAVFKSPCPLIQALVDLCLEKYWHQYNKTINMKCSMADFSRPRTVTVRLTSCSYLYLCFCCRGSGDGERKTHQS